MFLLTGIWHGAAWTFIAWGVWNGFFIIVERFLRIKFCNKNDDYFNSFFINILKTIYALFVINLGWVLFRAPNIHAAVDYMAIMFGVNIPKKIGFELSWYLDDWALMIMITGILFSSSFPTKIGEILKKCMPRIVFLTTKYIFLTGLLYLSIIRIVAGTYNPFIYFQF